MKTLFSSLVPTVLAASFWSWLVPVPDLPAGHDGLCRIAMAGTVETILCEVPLAGYDLTLRALDASDRPYETFENAAKSVSSPVVLAMNAGMYHEDRRPVGLTVQDGRTLKNAVLGTGSGNFSLRPNGVFYVENGRAFVRETQAYLDEGHAPALATQSGPMLLIDGSVHPRFIENSDSLYVRNGVGVSADGGIVYLALTRKPINFHDFAVFFRDTVGVRDALFFDGQVSSLSYPAAGIAYRRDRLGPILLVTEKD
ncbi:phosphodiester glycosidase family protein [Fulvimarina sp. 2208YS6-2-32]|uniref:Phosphodiester glycosidase family protein n=1 Tax=Fulvimarina uroteuthidis TaxID=3098149 RepID=A0ABU5I6T9_9HYPH|nr:phosphodiester glycosidase family protein [Fulvimarina sp. 2208YS6-2-32]MDY8111103.1 phosphodiester glycosidase family protein [Fulvimarina sp. 2208YS6-2-32]